MEEHVSRMILPKNLGSVKLLQLRINLNSQFLTNLTIFSSKEKNIFPALSF